MAKQKQAVLSKSQTPAPRPPAPPKTYGEMRLLVMVIFGIVGIVIARLFLFNDLEAARFGVFLRGQTGLDLGAMLASSAFWKTAFGFSLGMFGGYFVARELPADARSDIFARRAAIFLLVLVIYVPAMSAGFIWDDDQEITANSSLRDAQGLVDIWAGTKSADYFPLKTTMLWLEYRLWGLHAEGYHVMNILLHAVDALLLGMVLQRLLIPGAWLAALLFAIHPVHVESVAWIAERKNTLSLFFYLLAVLSYLKFERTKHSASYVWALVWFLAALLCKTHVVVLPAVLLLCAWWHHGFAGVFRDRVEDESERRLLKMTNVIVGVIGIAGGIGAAIYLRWLTQRFNADPNDAYVVSTNMFVSGGLPRLFWGLAAMCIGSGVVGLAEGVFGQRLNRHLVRTLAFFQIAILLGVVTVWFQYGRAIGTEEIPIGNFPRRLASAGMAVWWYLSKAFAPINLMEIYPTWPTESVRFIEFMPGVALVAFFVILWRLRDAAWARATLVALAYFVITLGPVLGFLKMSYMRLTLVADHFQYLSDIGICALIAAASVTLFQNMGPAWRPVLIGACGVLLATFSAYSWERAGVHQSEETLWFNTLQKNPDSWQAHNHLGAVRFMQQNYPEAKKHFAAAVKFKPMNPESHNNLGLALATEGKFDEAIAQYREAVRIKDDPSMRVNLANALGQQKRYEEAVEHYRGALKLDPRHAPAHCNLGYTLIQLGRYDEAIEELKKALETDPNMEPARKNLELLLQRKQQMGTGQQK